jgi:hypothetical protein
MTACAGRRQETISTWFPRVGARFLDHARASCADCRAVRSTVRIRGLRVRTFAERVVNRTIKMGVDMKALMLALLGLLCAAPVRRQQCSGCDGSAGGSGTSSSGGATASISVTLADHGKCKLFGNVDPEPGEPEYLCAAIRSCKVNVHREWSGQTPGATVSACHTYGPGTLFCVPGLTVDGDGAGEDDRNGVPVVCGGTASFSISVGTNDASITVSCSDCPVFQ